MGQGSTTDSADISQHAKVCLNCQAWVFKHEIQCANCQGTTFTEDLNHFITQAEKKERTTSYWVWGGIIGGGILAFVLLPFTFLVSGGVYVAVLRLLTKAIEAGEKRIEKQRERTQQLRQLFEAELYRKQYELACKQAEHARHVEQLIARGLVSIIQGNLVDAENSLSESLREGSPHFIAPLALGLLSIKAGRVDEGIGLLEDARMKLNGAEYDMILLHAYKACEKISLNGIQWLTSETNFEKLNWRDACWIADQLVAKGDAHSARRIYLGILKCCVPDLDQESIFRLECGVIATSALIEKGPPSSLGKWFVAHRQRQAAVMISAQILKKFAIRGDEYFDIFKAAWQIQPNNPYVIEALLDIYSSRQDFSNAKAVIDASVVHISTVPNLLYKSALLLFMNQEYDRGISLLQAIKSIPDWKQSVDADKMQLALSNGFFRRGMLDLAVECIGEIQDAPCRISEYYRLGSIALQKARQDVALKAFTEVYRLNAGYKDVSAQIDRLRGN
ncbi:MAG TPA: hypothetical protein PLX77_05400 [Candidatus Cloacimonadota bacterium]|nr:hypothetical protein [Candidatus Cloacimonadota bacterium]